MKGRVYQYVEQAMTQRLADSELRNTQIIGSTCCDDDDALSKPNV